MTLDLKDKLLENFTEYAEYVNNERAITYYYDGLKPVMRRVLYSMYKMKLKPEGQAKKCASIVGQVMAYHPHGDSGIYNALVRSAQDFSLLHPIIQGTGNLGTIDMPPAAMRYTEAKVSKVGWSLVEGLSDKTVPMIDNYDGTEQEPLFLPVPFPYLLVNGTSGIGVGMAASVPSHNLEDVIDATTHLIFNPDAPVEEVIKILKGPDFNSGCDIVNKDDFISIYKTGRGGFRMRSKFSITARQIRATNLPYRTSGAKRVEQINNAQARGELTFVREVIDMGGDVETLLIDINTKDTDMAIRELCRVSDLEKTFSLDLSVVMDGPKRVSLMDFFAAWIKTHKSLNRKKIIQDKEQAEARLHVLEGLLRATRMLDEVIKTIRASEARAEAKDALVKLGFSVEQSEAILEMKLARLTRLNELTLIKESEELNSSIEYWFSLLTNEDSFNEYVAHNMSLYKKMAQPRKSKLTQNVFAKVLKEVDSRFSVNFIKSKHKALVSEGASSKGINGDSTSPVYLLSDNSIVPVKNAKEAVIPKVFAVLDTGEDFVLHFSEDGYVKKTNIDKLKTSRKAIVAKQDKVIAVLTGKESTERYVLLTLNDGKQVQFTVQDISPTGRNARGVSAVKLESGQIVAKVEWTDKLDGVQVGRNKVVK